MTHRPLSLAILGVALAFGPAVAGETIAGSAAAIDGDSLEVAGREVRLHGIDAPEWDQLCERGGQRYRCGQVAARALRDRITGRRLECNVRDVDRYRRAVAACYLGGEDVNGWMVKQGHAVAYRRYSDDYVDEEEAARSAGRGVWAGDFVMPWDWRQGERL